MQCCFMKSLKTKWPVYIVSKCYPCITKSEGEVLGSIFKRCGCSPVCVLYGCKIAANVERNVYLFYPDLKVWPRLGFYVAPRRKRE